MEDEKKKQIKLLLKTVAEQQVQMTEQQNMIAELLAKVQERVRARSPINGTAQVAEIAIQKPEPEPVVHDCQEDIPDVAVVHEVIVIARQDVHVEPVPD